MELDHPIVFQPYKDSRALGGFILMDRLTNKHSRSGITSLCAAPRGKRLLAIARRHAESAGAPEKAAAVLAVVHGFVGSGKVDDRKSL
jgi:sulfate adenylyltransferase subunit 1 (EFTu-like GTPase family)